MNIVVDLEEAFFAGIEDMIYIFGDQTAVFAGEEAGELVLMNQEAFVDFAKGVNELCEKFSEEIGKNLIFFIKQYELKPSQGLKEEFEAIVENKALLIMMKKIFIIDIWRFMSSWREKRGWNLWRAFGWERDKTGYYGRDETKFKASIAQESALQDIQIIHYFDRETFRTSNPNFIRAKNDYWFAPIVEVYRIYLEYSHPTVEIEPIHNRVLHYKIPTNDEILEQLRTGRLRAVDILLYEDATLFKKQQQVVNSFLVSHTLYLQWYLTWLGLTGYTLGYIDELPEEMETQWYIYPPVDKIPGINVNFTHSTGTHLWDDVQDDAFRAYWTGSKSITSTTISPYGWRIMNGIYSFSGHNAFKEGGMEQVKSWYEINFPEQSLGGVKSEMVGGTTTRVPIMYKDMISDNYYKKKHMITEWFQNEDSLLIYGFLYDLSQANIDDFGEPKYKVGDKVYFYQADWNTAEDESFVLGTITSSEGVVNGVYRYMIQVPTPKEEGGGWETKMYPENKIYGTKAAVDKEKEEFLAKEEYEEFLKTHPLYHAKGTPLQATTDFNIGTTVYFKQEDINGNIKYPQADILSINGNGTIFSIRETTTGIVWDGIDKVFLFMEKPAELNIPTDSIEGSMKYKLGDRVWINTTEYKGWGTINLVDTQGNMYDVIDNNNIVYIQVQELETYSTAQEVPEETGRYGVMEDDRTVDEIMDDKIEKYDNSQLVGSYATIHSDFEDNYNQRIGIITSIQTNNIAPIEYIIQFADNDSANFLREEFTISTKEDYDIQNGDRHRLQTIQEEVNIIPVTELETPAVLSSSSAKYSIGDWYFKKYDFRYYKIEEKGAFPNSWKTGRYNDEGVKLGGSLKMEEELDELTPKTEEELPWNRSAVYNYSIGDWFFDENQNKYYNISEFDNGDYKTIEYNSRGIEYDYNREGKPVRTQNELDNYIQKTEEELPWNGEVEAPIIPKDQASLMDTHAPLSYKYNIDDWFKEEINFIYYFRIIKRFDNEYKMSIFNNEGEVIGNNTYSEQQIDKKTPITENDLPWKQIPDVVSSATIDENEKPILENQNILDDGKDTEIGDPNPVVVNPQIDLSSLINKYIALRLILMDMRNDLEFKKNAEELNGTINQYIFAVNQSITIMKTKPSSEIKTQFTDYITGYYENIQILRDSVDKLPISKEPLAINFNVPVKEGSVHSLLIPIVIGGIIYISIR